VSAKPGRHRGTARARPRGGHGGAGSAGGPPTSLSRIRWSAAPVAGPPPLHLERAGQGPLSGGFELRRARGEDVPRPPPVMPRRGLGVVDGRRCGRRGGGRALSGVPPSRVRGTGGASRVGGGEGAANGQSEQIRLRGVFWYFYPSFSHLPGGQCASHKNTNSGCATDYFKKFGV